MDEMTQHNAALVEETNAAIEQTEAQATELDGIIDVFRTQADAAPAMAPAASRPAARPVPRSAPLPRAVGNTALAEDWDEF